MKDLKIEMENELNKHCANNPEVALSLLLMLTAYEGATGEDLKSQLITQLLNK